MLFIYLFRKALPLLLLLSTIATYAQTAPAWQNARTIGSGTFYTTTVSTAVDGAGNVYHAGSFLNSVTVGGSALTSHSEGDIYLAKFSPTGTLLWTRQIGSAGLEYLLDMTVDAAGHAYLTGYFTTSVVLSSTVQLTGNGTQAAFLLRYSPEGEPEWAQQSAVASRSSNGSSVRTDNAGHVYLTGRFLNSLTMGGNTITAANTTAVYLAKFEAATGAPQQLLVAYAFPPGGGIFDTSHLLVAPSGAVYIFSTFYQSPTFSTGITLTSRGDSDVLVARYSAQGSFEWAQQLGGPSFDLTKGGILDNSENLYLTGAFTGPFTAGSQTLPGAGAFDGYLAKYSAQGTLQWISSIGGPANDQLHGVGLDATGFPYVTGYFTGTTQVGSQNLTSVANSADVAVVAYTPQGQVRWATQAGGPDFDFGTNLYLTSNGQPLVFGYYGGACTFGPYTVQATSSQETFAAVLGSTVVLSARGNYAPLLSIYPNPATTMVHISGLAAGSRVQLLDALGRLVRTATLTSTTQVSVQGLVPGLYTLRATDQQGKQFAGKLVVE